MVPFTIDNSQFVYNRCVIDILQDVYNAKTRNLLIPDQRPKLGFEHNDVDETRSTAPVDGTEGREARDDPHPGRRPPPRQQRLCPRTADIQNRTISCTHTE